MIPQTKEIFPEHSFYKGWGKVEDLLKPKCKADIKAYFKMETDTAFYQRRRGAFQIKPPYKRSDIEAIFKRYGVKKKDVWGYIGD